MASDKKKITQRTKKKKLAHCAIIYWNFGCTDGTDRQKKEKCKYF